MQTVTKFFTDPNKKLYYSHKLWTPNEGINQRNLKIWANVADKICFGRN